MGFPLTPGSWVAGRLALVMYWAVCTTLSTAIPGRDATGQDALDGAAVELFEDLGTRAKSFQSPEGYEYEYEATASQQAHTGRSGG